MMPPSSIPRCKTGWPDARAGSSQSRAARRPGSRPLKAPSATIRNRIPAVSSRPDHQHAILHSIRGHNTAARRFAWIHPLMPSLASWPSSLPFRRRQRAEDPRGWSRVARDQAVPSMSPQGPRGWRSASTRRNARAVCRIPYQPGRCPKCRRHRPLKRHSVRRPA